LHIIIIIAALVVSYRFPICCCISKPQRVKGDWCRKSRRNFAVFDPLKNFVERWANVWVNF